MTGLANEDSLYKKLLGVIKEVGMELGRTAQNDVYAKERLMTSKMESVLQFVILQAIHFV